jgi:hypothetical protein
MPLTKIGVRLSRIGLFAKPIIQQMSHVHMVFFQFSMVKWKQKKQRGISSMKKGKSLRSGFPHQLCMDIIITERGKFYDENIVCY